MTTTYSDHERTIGEAYLAGRYCADQKGDVKDNPFYEGTEQFDAWLSGHANRSVWNAKHTT